MNVLCLCPVYGHPRSLIENSIECFNRQTYPENQRCLLVIDDLGTLSETKFSSPNVFIASTANRFHSLPEKYNTGMRYSSDWSDAICVWEVDDLYLPGHIDRTVAALEHHEWAHPNRAWSTYTGAPEIEDARGRFHAALAFRRSFFAKYGGWPVTKRADFDQQMLAKCRDLGGPRGIPDGIELPKYVFRWNDTGVPHGQGVMRGPDDETWYDRYQPYSREPIVELTPRLDPAAEKAFHEISLRSSI